MSGRHVILLIVLMAGAVGLYVWQKPAHPKDAPTSREAADPATEVGAAAGEQAKTREALAQVGKILAQAQLQKHIVPSQAEQRQGESAEFWKERTQAVREYQRFVQMARVSPEHEETLRGLIYDAQENWKQALKSVGRTQPTAPGAEMSDPVLMPLFTGINEEFMRNTRESLTETERLTVQSFMPTMLPFVRTQAFEVK